MESSVNDHPTSTINNNNGNGNGDHTEMSLINQLLTTNHHNRSFYRWVVGLLGGRPWPAVAPIGVGVVAAGVGDSNRWTLRYGVRGTTGKAGVVGRLPSSSALALHTRPSSFCYQFIDYSNGSDDWQWWHNSVELIELIERYGVKGHHRVHRHTYRATYGEVAVWANGRVGARKSVGDWCWWYQFIRQVVRIA